jgi:hypothetical protein
MKNNCIAFIVMTGFLLAFGCGGGDDDNTGTDNNTDGTNNDGTGTDDNTDGTNNDGTGTDNNTDGTNNDGTGTQVDLSVDEDKVASEMTEDEINAVCGDIYDAISAYNNEMQAPPDDIMCQSVGVMMTARIAMMGGTDAELVASCEETVQACENGEMDDQLADYGDTSDEPMTEEEFCSGADESVQDCDATAGEIADCFAAIFDAEMAAGSEYMNQIPDCSELTAAYFETMDQYEEVPEEEVATPAECNVIQQKCPQMLEDME